GAWTAYDADYLRKSAADMEPEFGRVEVHDCTSQWGVFAIAGPKSRDAVASISTSASSSTRPTT
ncbi:MAG: hypothetical protein AAF191_17920, partial [Verrucomicrobiota bacterium]